MPRARSLSVMALAQPSRLPTTVRDPGFWWGTVASRGHRVGRLDLNAAWWKTLCWPPGYRLVSGERPLHSWMPSAGERSAIAAGSGLHALKDRPTYASAEAYCAAVAPISEYLELLRSIAAEVGVEWAAGPTSRRADYADSRSLLTESMRPGPYRGLIEAALPLELAEIDLLVVSVTTPEDLLSAMTAVHLLRQRQPRLHACLADHGYENFSLRPHADALRASGALGEAFDTIVEARDERDAVVVALADALASGDEPRGWLRAGDLPAAVALADGEPEVAPPLETFAPEPVLMTRVSERRCYWSRCTFCIHNAKYDSPAPPSRAEVDASVTRLAAFMEAGFRTMIFMDEALSPALLARLSERLIDAGLPQRGMRWACRSKLEMAHDGPLFAALRAAGCREVLFGIESTSAATLHAMDKYAEGLTSTRMLETVAAASDAGVGVHINLIAGFPGDGPEELAESLRFVALAGRAPNVTFTLNPFVVFPATPVHDRPERFGVELAPTSGDMPAIRDYGVVGDQGARWRASMAALPSLAGRLRTVLGWDSLDAQPGGRMARDLYFGSGHGAIFKSMPSNPFATGVEMQPGGEQ